MLGLNDEMDSLALREWKVGMCVWNALERSGAKLVHC